ncbi:HIT family protein [bacterium]|nr:HIT family protein [bacterium]
MSECLFCQEWFQAQKIWEDQYFSVVADRSPVNPGHLLAITKAHRDDWFQLTREEKVDLLDVIEQMKKLATSDVVYQQYVATLQEPDVNPRTKFLCDFAVKNWQNIVKNCTGYNLGCNCGRDAGQSQLHFHYHLIPRFSGDCADAYGGVRRCISERGDYRADAPNV